MGGKREEKRVSLQPQNITLEDRKERIEELVKEQEVHRTGDQEGPFSIHILGLGKTGASVIEQLLSSPPDGFLEDDRTMFSALAALQRVLRRDLLLLPRGMQARVRPGTGEVRRYEYGNGERRMMRSKSHPSNITLRT